MTAGTLITRGTIWLALLCYVATVVLQTRSSSRATFLTRSIWMTGCVLLIAHIAAAFHFVHHWSHALAENGTRLETIERTGLNFGGGIYFNYLLGLMWLVDCAGWPLRGKHLHESNRRWHAALHIFFLFMIFNATVVFGHGWARPVGAILCTVAASSLILRTRFPT